MALLCLPAPVTDLRDDEDLWTRIEAEFREMPGLTLTLPQAARLFGLERDRCKRVLDTLVHTGLLSTDGRTFARADIGRRCV